MNAMDNARRLTATLKSTKIDNAIDYATFNLKVSQVLTGLNTWWANPADKTEAENLKTQLVAAWDAAAHFTS